MIPRLRCTAFRSGQPQRGDHEIDRRVAICRVWPPRLSNLSSPYLVPPSNRDLWIAQTPNMDNA
jgi:hypothetical protein